MKIAQNIIEILATSEVTGNKLVLPGQLDRSTYQAVDKVLKALDAKWSKKDGGHIFQEDAADLIDDVIATGEYRRVKVDLQQFDTPDDLALRVIQLAGIEPGMNVLEPSAGIGRLVKQIVAAGGVPHAFEIDDKRRAKLEASGLMRFPVASGDFLTFDAGEPFADACTMNPPFSRAQDIAHVTHSLKFVKKGGLLVSIMSPGVKFRQGRKYDEFRKLMKEHDGEIFDVEAGAFEESGTRIRTVIVRMRK
jgi:hypothetical protein